MDGAGRRCGSALLLGVVVCVVTAAAVDGAAAEEGARQPNLVLLLADDLGYADLSCYGGTAVETPHLDALAAGGMRFTQFYAASAVCTPTRASLLTGRYPLRFDIRSHFRDGEEHLPPGTVTLPALLRGGGYATAHIGKWHLGGLNVKHIANRAANIPGPHEHGFAHYLCGIEGPGIRRSLVQTRKLYREGARHLVRNDRRVDPIDRHWTDVKIDEAVALIEEYGAAGRPFFLNVWFDVPHMPYEPAPEPHLSRYAGGAKGDQLFFRSMVSHMDAGIGRFMERLRELDLERDTLVVFTSDNGAAWQGNTGPWKGGKTDLHEGGIRVPMIAYWPGRIAAGRESNVLAHTNDILPTFCAAAGIALPGDTEFDGIDLLPHLLEGATPADRGTVFWQLDLYPRIQRPFPKPEPYATEIARRGKWKLLARDGEPVELFDLESDPGETKNLLQDHPQLVEELAGELRAWLAEPRRGWE